jgi:hypothetical protein
LFCFLKCFLKKFTFFHICKKVFENKVFKKVILNFSKQVFCCPYNTASPGSPFGPLLSISCSKQSQLFFIFLKKFLKTRFFKKVILNFQNKEIKVLYFVNNPAHLGYLSAHIGASASPA